MLFTREVPDHAVPVTRDELVEGEVYFSLTFSDDTLTVPYLEPVVYVGRDLEPGDLDQVYFQDHESYKSGARFDQSVPGVQSTFISGDNPNHLFKLEQAIDVLLMCLLKRRARDVR